MAITRIATSQKIPYYSEIVDLDGENFLMVFKWNFRDSTWYFSLYQEDETPVAVGMRLVVGWNPLRRLVGTDRPLGSIYVHDTVGTDVEAGFEELGTRVLVLYYDEDEIASLS